MDGSRLALSGLVVVLFTWPLSVRANQPNRIDLNPNGVSRIYPPFDTNGWVLTRWAGDVTHQGDDWFAQDWSIGCHSEGYKLYAGISGEIFLNYVGTDAIRDQGHGNTLVIYDSSSGFALRYAHMQEFALGLQTGSRITAGEYIGKVGYSGNVEPSSACASLGGHGAHLHIVLYKNVSGINSRPVIDTIFKGSATTYSADFTYTTPIPLIKGNQRADVYAVFTNPFGQPVSRVPVSWFVFNNQGWNFTSDTRFLNAVQVQSQPNVDVLLLSSLLWPPREGTLVRGDTDPTVYYIQDREKRGVTAAIFACRNFRFEDVLLVSQGEVDRYPPGRNPPVLTGCIHAFGGFDPNPTLTTDASANPNPTTVNQVVTINTGVVSTGGPATDVLVVTGVYNSSGSKLFENVVAHQNFPAGQSQSYLTSWTSTTVGQYTVKVDVFNSSRTVTYSHNDQAVILNVDPGPPPPPAPQTVNIIPNVLFNGTLWRGAIWLRITGPKGTIVNRDLRTPDETFAVPPGRYTVQYVSGGPSEASLSRIRAADPCGSIGTVEVSCDLTSSATNYGFFFEFSPASPPRGPNITGRVTDPNGNGIGGVDVSYGGARWTPDGFQILQLDDEFTDANGQYAIKNAFIGFTYNVTPLRQGFYFTPRYQRFENLNGDKVANFVGKPSPSPAPMIITEQGTDHAIVLDSVTSLRDPLPVNTNLNFSPDDRTRVSIFVANLSLPGGEAFTTSDITVIAEAIIGYQTFAFIPIVEYVGRVPQQDWLAQLIFKFPDEPGLIGDVSIKLNFLGSLSNSARINIDPTPLQFVSFVEGDPQLPGDGILVNASGGLNPNAFEFQEPIALRGTKDGFTFTFFVPPSGPALSSASFNIVSLKPSPCDASFGASGSFVSGKITYNGIKGSFVNIPQSQLDSYVQGANSFNPGCNFTINDLFIGKIYLYPVGSSGPANITVLDAAAIGRGQNNYPGVLVP